MTATLHTVSMNRSGWVPLMNQQYVHIFVLLKFKVYCFVLLYSVFKQQQQQTFSRMKKDADKRAREEEQLE